MESKHEAGNQPTKIRDGSQAGCFLNLVRPLQTCLLGNPSTNRKLLESPTEVGLASLQFAESTGASIEAKNPLLPSTDSNRPSSLAVTDVDSGPSRSHKDHKSMRLEDLHINGLSLNPEPSFEELEDDLLITLNGELEHLAYFKELHDHGIRKPHVLQSIAYLSSQPNRDRNHSTYYEHVAQLACFLAITRATWDQKKDVLQTMMRCLSAPDDLWQTQDLVIERTLRFITSEEKAEWEYPEHSESYLLWEVRAMSLRLLELPHERAAQLAKTGDTAAIMISVGAKLVEEGMARSVPVISSQIDRTVSKVKENIRPDDYPLIVDQEAIVALTFSDAARRVSETAREETRKAVGEIYNVSSKGIRLLADQLDETNMSNRLPPEGREALKAAGKVGMATIGAAAIIGEALLETSRAVLEQTAAATADVVEHKYGTSAGQVASDAGETAVNVHRAFSNVTLVSEGTVLAKSLARQTGKDQVQQEVEKAKETMRALENQASAFVQSANLVTGRLGITSTPLLPSIKTATSNVPETSEAGSAPGSPPEEPMKSFQGKVVPEITACSSTESESSASGPREVYQTLSSDSESRKASTSSSSSTVASSRSSIARRGKQHAIPRGGRKGNNNHSKGSKRIRLKPGMTIQ